MKTKTKQKWRKDTTITVSTLSDVSENPKGCFNNEEKLINIYIDKGYMETSCSFEFSKKGKKEALDFIKKELYL